MERKKGSKRREGRREGDKLYDVQFNYLVEVYFHLGYNYLGGE